MLTKKTFTNKDVEQQRSSPTRKFTNRHVHQQDVEQQGRWATGRWAIVGECLVGERLVAQRLCWWTSCWSTFLLLNVLLVNVLLVNSGSSTLVSHFDFNWINLILKKKDFKIAFHEILFINQSINLCGWQELCLYFSSFCTHCSSVLCNAVGRGGRW